MRHLITTITLFLMGASTAKAIDNRPVSNLDVERYMGLWYEVARFDNKFEKNLVDVTAEYTLESEDRISVINRGVNTKNGRYKSTKGKARTTSEAGTLEVSFFLFFYAPYIVLELDEEYQWALVGSSSDKYLWILSRTPKLEPETLNRILMLAKKRGYNTKNLIYPGHKL